MKETDCHYQPPLNDEEAEGLNWVTGVMEKIVKKGPEHRSFEKAQACLRALRKLHTHCGVMHLQAHILELAATGAMLGAPADDDLLKEHLSKFEDGDKDKEWN